MPVKLSAPVAGFAGFVICQFGPVPAAWAQQAESTQAADTAPASSAMANPPMAGPLVANPNPFSFEPSPFGTVYVTGVVSGFALVQGDPVSVDKTARIDLGNAMVILQKTDGPFQFFVQAGGYSLPSLGTPYITARRTIGDFYGPVPVAYAKIAPTDEFSLQAGKLTSPLGSEYTFTFQNMNIERGLLWNQEPSISRGIQANYTIGPLALTLSLTDGYYSNRYNWLTGSATYTIDKSNSLGLAASGNFSSTATSTLVTPLFQSNSQIVDLMYTYSAAPWTISPYFQATNVPASSKLGILHDAATFSGAVLASYAFNDNVSLAGRAEDIASTGSVANGAPNLLYGPGSTAWSVTLTPTYQQGILFVREEVSFVQANGITPGLAFGRGGNTRSQARVMVEGGVLF
jgi:hypothetical protein